MFGLIKKIFFELLSNIFNGCNHNKCDSLSNQKCIIQTTLINSHPNKYSQEVIILSMTYLIKYVVQIKQTT